MIKNCTQPILMQKLFDLLERYRFAYQQERTYRRVVEMVLGEIFNFGRHTVTQGLMAVGIVDGIGVVGIGCSSKGGMKSGEGQRYFSERHLIMPV